MLKQYKPLIDQGYSMPYSEALLWEEQQAIESAKQASAVVISARREAVMERGRAKKMQDKVALVMGGGAGTGRATALAFARSGARVVVADINEGGARQTEALIDEAGGEAVAVTANMGLAADIQRVMDTCKDAFGGLHMVSNNAALAAPNRPVTELSEKEWDKCMGVTLKGVWLCMKYQCH